MDEKTKALVEAAEKRAEAATPGVWKLFGMAVLADVDGTSDLATAIPVANTHYRNEDGHPRTNDATFIAAARQDIPALCAAVREQDARLTAAVEIIFRHGMTDGSHHKQWVLDQALRALLGDGYENRIKEENADEEYAPWDEGCAP